MLIRRHPRLVLALLALTVCNRPSREAQEVPAQEQPAVESPVAVAVPVAEVGPAPVCDEEHRDAVRKELQDMCLWSAHLAVVDVPMSPWGGTPHGGSSDVRIAVDRDQIRVLPGGSGQWMIGEGPPLAEQVPITLSDLAGTLAAIPSHRTNKEGELQPLVWSLQIASDVSSTVVADVLRILSNAKMLNGQLELRTSEGPAAVRDPILHAKLDASREKLVPEQRIGWAKQELERFAGPCLSFDDAIEAANLVDPSQSCWALSTGLANTISDCGCGREAEVLTVMYSVVFGAEPPKNRATPVRTRISPDATPRRGKTWGSIVAGLEKKEDALSLWVSGKE